jgi:predicted nuclease of restriction endonuclease-like RecB superfamily
VLTADLVRARRRSGKLYVIKLEGAPRTFALEIAEQYLQLAARCVGQPRETFEQACAAVSYPGQYRRLAAGLLKLVTDRCVFEAESEQDPRELRREVFVRASQLWQGLDPEKDFCRDAILAQAAAERGISPEEVERLLYADLRGAHPLLSFSPLSAEQLIEQYCTAQNQAVLLRATRVTVQLEGMSSASLRHLFHKLKFLQLLFFLERSPSSPRNYQLTIDGPYSLFRSVTKYGLQLALFLPTLESCAGWTLTADILWGKERQPLAFELQGAPRNASSARVGRDHNDSEAGTPEVSAEMAALMARFSARGSPWRVTPVAEVFHLPGVGLCVPDLLFEHSDHGTRIYFELLGYWSRQAVWQRVDLVEKGLPQRFLFAVSERLRVHEAVLPEDVPGALYVFKGVMNCAAIEAKLDLLAGRQV